jgi:hypothetical protein
MGVPDAYDSPAMAGTELALVDAVSPGASTGDAERVVLLAVMGHDGEIHDPYQRVSRLAPTGAGYLRERMEEDNPVSAIRQRLRLPFEAGQLGVTGAAVVDWSSAASFMPALLKGTG